MEQKIIGLIASAIAACIIMIFHELSKAIVYNIRNKEQSTKTKMNIYKINHYIDPIGLIFSITTATGFSKPYMYRIKEKKTNFLLGITGFISLIVIFIVSLILFKMNYGAEGVLLYETISLKFYIKYFFYNLNFMLVILSFTMIIVNMFPISTFDMGLLIAGKSPSKYFSIIKNDQYIKMILVLTIVFDIIRSISLSIINLFI
jgi:hypothetical protein